MSRIPFSLLLASLLASLLAAGAISADPITYPVPEGSRWQLYDTRTEGIVPPEPPAVDRPWPRGDGGALQGIDPASYPYRWLRVETRFPAVESYDPGIHAKTTTVSVEIEPAPSVLGRYVTVEDLTLLPPDALEVTVRSQYQTCLGGLGADRSVGAAMMAAAALDAAEHKQTDGDVASAVTAWRNAVTGYDQACMQRRDALLAEIDAMRARLSRGEPAGPTPGVRLGWPVPPVPPPAS